MEDGGRALRSVEGWHQLPNQIRGQGVLPFQTAFAPAIWASPPASAIGRRECIPINNPYWPLAPGKQWVYREVENGVAQRVVVTATNRAKVIDGVTARVVHDVVSAGGHPIELPALSSQPPTLRRLRCTVGGRRLDLRRRLPGPERLGAPSPVKAGRADRSGGHPSLVHAQEGE